MQVLDAFGPGRVMWGTDFTRVPVPFREGVDYLRGEGLLSEADRERVMGGTLRSIFCWTRQTNERA